MASHEALFSLISDQKKDEAQQVKAIARQLLEKLHKLVARSADTRGRAKRDQGIWSRWCSDIANGHGGNVELKALVGDPSLDDCSKAFRFALLDARPVASPDEVIIARESFWKRILFTRGADGLNRN